MKEIEAIIFDFGGVILDIDYNLTSKAFEHLGVTDFYERYSQQNADSLFKNLEEGKITEEEFFAAFRKSTGTILTDEQVRDAWNAMLLCYRPQALALVQQIKHKYKCYILSNTNSIHVKKFSEMYRQQLGTGSMRDHFKKVYYSHEIGHRKPGKEAYEWVIRDNNLEPGHTLFIDDSVQNLVPARELGLQTIWLQKGMEIQGLGL